MAEFPKHLEHITKLTEEEAKAMNFKERYRDMAEMDESGMLAEIDNLFLTRNDTDEMKANDNGENGASNQERSSSGSKYRILTIPEVEDVKDLYRAFKYHDPAYAPTFDEMTTGRMMDPPLFKPRYPPVPGLGQVSGYSESSSERPLSTLSVSQQSNQGDRADNKSSEAGTDLATAAAPRSGTSRRPCFR
jgi:hypothetical protein